DYSFVWSDNSGVATSSTTTNQFVARASGGFLFYTSGLGTGASLAPGSGSWSAMSDRNAKENFQTVDAQAGLNEVTALPLTPRNYKTQDKAIRHIGPMAQDFHAAFRVGENNTTISTVDEGGVALAAIQGLNMKVESGKQQAESRLERLEAENADLKARLER